MIDLTPIINLIIALIGAVIAVFVIPWLKKNISQQDMDKMMELIKIAVYAAQQLHWDKSGDERKQYVLDFLAENGYDINDQAVLNAIEAEVLKLHKALSDDGETNE